MKRRTLALILAAALTVTSVEGTAVMASAAEFTSEAAEETEAELETAPEDSADVAVLSDQGDSSELNEIEISDSESQDSDSWEADIEGAAGVGMHQMFYNPSQRKDLPFRPTFMIGDWEEAVRLISQI